MSRTIGRGIRALAVVAVLVASLAFAGSALAIEKNKLTPKAGVAAGQPNTLKYEAYTSKDETVTRLELHFPQGTDLSKATIRFAALQGLERTDTQAKSQINGTNVTFELEPPVGPDRFIQIVFTEVVTPMKRGVSTVTGTYESNGGTKQLQPASYSIPVPTVAQRITAWLDKQPAVAAWNSVPILNAFFKPQLIVLAIPVMFLGWLMSIALVLVSYTAAIPLGLTTAFVKMSKIPPLRWLAALYINVIRGTPLFLQIYIGFFGLPLIGIRLPDFFLAVIVLAFNSAAYMAEIFRAGIQSIHKGQFEAASSLGMTYPAAMAYVIIPQTVRRVLPTMTSEFILLFKDTALLSAVGVFELMMYGKNFAANSGNVTSYTVAAAYYLILTIPLINYVGNLESKLAESEGGQSASSPRKSRRWLRRPASAAVAPNPTAAPDVLAGPEQHD